MGHIDAVMEALRKAGIRVQRAYPGRPMPVITEPVAAVSLAQADPVAGTTKVCVAVVSPAQLGGAACEDQAEKAARAVAALGAQCVQEACSFDSAADHYCTQIFASFTGSATPTFLVKVGNIALPNAVRFEAWQEVNAELGASLAYARWQIRLEETFLPGQAENITAGEPFVLTVTRDRSTELFDGCVWTKVQRIDNAGQLQQVRIGTAATRSFITK